MGKIVKRSVTLALLLTGFWLMGVSPAWAYVDPGTGSFIFQAVIGGLLAAGVMIKVFWKKIVGVFSRRDRTDG